jgi:hypothetical protein
MANKILTGEGWEKRVRSKLGVSEPYLSDDDIRQPDVISVSEATIIKQVPDYESFEGDDKTYLEAAVVCACAALLCPSMPARLPNKEAGPHESHSLYTDWNKLKIELEVERDGYIGSISTVSFPDLLHFRIT